MHRSVKPPTWSYSMERLLLLLLGVLTCVHSQTRHDHLTTSCDVSLVTSVGGRLEASTELNYENNMDCTFKVAASPPTKRLLILFNWFDIERKIEGACVDYMNIHDGSDVTAPTLNSEPLCGEQRSLGNFTTTGNHVTFRFVTDNNAVWRGFDLTYTVFDYAPCGTGDFQCNNSLCIASSLTCDGFSHCGDGSDETDLLCTIAPAAAIQGRLSMGAMIGISAGGLVLLIVLIVVLYKVIDYYRWQRWLRENDLHRNPWDEEDDLYQYPVTQHYKKGRETPPEVMSPTGKTSPEVTSPTESETSRVESEETKWRTGKSGTLFLSSEELNKPLSSEA